MKQHVWKRLHTKPVLSEDESPLPLASPVHPEGHHPFPGLMFCQTHLWDLRQVSAQLGCNWAAAAVQSPSCGRLFVTPWTAARQASLSLTSSRSLPKFKSIESVMPSNHLIFCHPLLLLPTATADDGGSGTYKGLGWRIEIKGNFMPEDELPGITQYEFYLMDELIHAAIRD